MRWSCRQNVSTARALLVVMCLGAFGCSQRETADSSNMMCVQRLQIPSYPPIAQAARSSIAVSAAIKLANDGTVQTVVLEGTANSSPQKEGLFRATIEQTIRASAFDPACANKMVRVSYVFKMDAARDVTASWFGYPNRVEVWAVTPLADHLTGR